MKASIVMLLYAAALVGIGFLTYSVAPPGANATTALIISSAFAGIMVFCAIASLAIRQNRTLGMVGIHVGLVMPLVVAAGSFMRFPGSLNNTQQFNEAITQGSVTISAQRDQTGAEPPPVAYQTVGIGSTAIISLFAFGAILTHRPKVPKKEKKKD